METLSSNYYIHTCIRKGWKKGGKDNLEINISGCFYVSKIVILHCNHFLMKDVPSTTYKEVNFTDCTKMHISSPLNRTLRLELFAPPTVLNFSVQSCLKIKLIVNYCIKQKTLYVNHLQLCWAMIYVLSWTTKKH